MALARVARTAAACCGIVAAAAHVQRTRTQQPTRTAATFGAWTACRASIVDHMVGGIAGQHLSERPFHHDTPAWLQDARVCIPATVPGTALHTLIQNGTFPGVTDPFVDDVLQSIIPDISVTGPDFWTMYYSVNFTISGDIPAGYRALLRLDQVNYRARVWVDGRLVPPLDADGQNGTVGMFRRWYFDLGAAESGVHGLAVLVQPPDNFGNASNTCQGCGQGGNHEIAKDVTSQYTAGWDWIGGTPDRNTGIIDMYGIEVVGPVVLRDPVVDCRVSSVAYSTGAGDVDVTFSVATRALGNQGATPVAITLAVPELGIRVNTSAVVPAAGSGWSDITLNTQPIHLTQVALWWPATLGSPRLYTANVLVFTADGALAYELSWRVGLRQVSAEIDPKLGGQTFRVNGARVFLQGGNWIAPDQLDRFYSVPERWAVEVALHAAAGLNLIRLWGGAGGTPATMYDAADAAGVFIMHEFWMTGDNNGRWAGNYSWPLSHAVYLGAAHDTVSLLRGHASLLFWCAGNELFPQGSSPPPDIAAGLQQMVTDLDISQRPLILSTMSSLNDFDPSYALAPQDGPYGIMDERIYFTKNPGLANGTIMPMAFQPEIGNTACPEYASMQRFLTAAHLEALPPANTTSTQVDPVWAYHRYIPFTDGSSGTPVDHLYAYGAPANASEYAVRAALAQFRQYQAMYEGFQQYMWIYYGAILMWKTQAPWPSFRGFLYDWYLAPTGSFWGVRAGTNAGAALHVQLNQLTGGVTVLNKGLLDAGHLQVGVQAYSIRSGAALYSPAITHNVAGIAAGAVLTLAPALPWPQGAGAGEVVLFRLELLTASQPVSVLSRNDYWLSNMDSHLASPQDYSSLAEVRERIRVPLHASAIVTSGPRTNINITLRSPVNSQAVAFAVRVTVRDPSRPCLAATGAVDDRVLPVMLSDDMFSLVPGETRLISAWIDPSLFAASMCGGSVARAAPPATTGYLVDVSGWNVVPTTLTPQSASNAA